ncbi:MAG: hypothetical protein MI920_24010 [Kiloniellales bacterium]|nr:hypothetical protein [Kiloniellales bacterium]
MDMLQPNPTQRSVATQGRGYTTETVQERLRWACRSLKGSRAAEAWAVMAWLDLLDSATDRRLVFAVSAGHSFRRLALWFGRSHEWVRQRYSAAIGELTDSLNAVREAA